MNKIEMKRVACAKIDEYREDILEAVKTIYENPETGYKEKRTTELVQKMFEKLNLKTKNDIAVTGVKAQVRGNGKGRHLTILGELDAVINKEHPDADKNTGAVHACGHNNQLGIMLGIAYGIIKSNIISKLNGVIDFIAAPAEEYIELDYRDKIRKKGKIKYFGGKQELIRQSYFDKVDIAIMAHSMDLGEMKDVIIAPSSNGFIRKKVSFIDDGNLDEGIFQEEINTLDALEFAINGLNIGDSNYIDKKKTRIYTNNKELMKNYSSVIMETYVKGETVKKLLDVNEKVDRRIKKATESAEVRVKICNTPGYLPLLNYESLIGIFRDNLDGLIEKDKVIEKMTLPGFFDIGDLSQIIPVLHPFFSGVKGSLHSKKFKTVDYEKAVINPAKAITKTIIDMLSEQNKKLGKLKSAPYNKEEYLKLLEEISC
ncbi:MAG: amidohydrolase [Halanaerobiales bacterium]